MVDALSLRSVLQLSVANNAELIVSCTLDSVFKRLNLIASAILTGVLIMAGAFLIFDVFFRALSQHAIMNVEGIIAISFLALLCARSSESELKSAGAAFDGFAIAAIIIVVAVAFVPILHTSFLYDDYTHITDASRFTWRSVAAQFGPVAGRGLFFRPLGFFFYWLNYLWAGSHATWWHAANIALHAACSALMYLFCREVGLPRPASFGGTLLFGLAGVSAESVAWVDAGFVILTTALLLISLICVCRYATTGDLLWLTGALSAGTCAMLCKETAFSWPFLVGSLAFLKDRKSWNRIRRATILAAALTIIIFAYRWWALNGIGGYSVAGGEANILHFNMVRTIDALLLRQWAVLFFPFNWTIPSSPILRGALAATSFILVVCAWLAAPPRRPMIGCFVFIFAAALPVQHLLLISPDLGGSRTLYLGSVGWALLWALILEAMHRTPRIVVTCVLLVLQCSILEHNLEAWRETAELARSVCVGFGRNIAVTSGLIVVRGLPAIRHGAVFLQNGFPQCVELNSGVPAWRIQVIDSEVPGAREFRWNKTSGRIE